MSTSENNKRIAKNTILLYFRMLLLMLVSLYTSRVVLNALGVEDYGIYNVVGGVVAMFSVISGSLSAAISRFITFELGKDNSEPLKKVFSMAVTIQIVMALAVLIIAETLGLWFLNFKMVIPSQRLLAANIVFHFSILTFIINLLAVPYNAAIIAHEKMSAFAYISIVEAILKLLVAYLIVVSPIDNLVFYAILMCSVAFIIRFVYGFYCKRHFEECTYHFVKDGTLLRKMLGFSGWNFFGALAAVLRDQGVNIVINLFAGPSVNAARGISVQVNSAVNSFVSNFMTAINPQITKSYASGNTGYTEQLVIQGARFSFYLLLVLTLPIFLNVDYVLYLWLGTVPKYTNMFVCLSLIFAISECLSYPLITTLLAIGKIKKYQVIVGGIIMLNLPLSYFFLSIGYSPTSVLVVAIVLSQCCLIVRLYLLYSYISFNVWVYLKKVYMNVLLVTSFALLIPSYLKFFVCFNANFINFLCVTLISFLMSILSIYIIGCNKQEKAFLSRKLQSILNKYDKH